MLDLDFLDSVYAGCSGDDAAFASAVRSKKAALKRKRRRDAVDIPDNPDPAEPEA